MAYQQNYEKPRSNPSPSGQTLIIPSNFLTDANSNFNDLGKDFILKNKDERNDKPNFTTTQIRKFLSAVNAITNHLEAEPEKFNKNDIQYLRVKLAYQAGRERKLEPLYKNLDPVLSQIKNAEDFKKFARLMESIVAYHKFYGGAD